MKTSYLVYLTVPKTAPETKRGYKLTLKEWETSLMLKMAVFITPNQNSFRFFDGIVEDKRPAESRGKQLFL